MPWDKLQLNKRVDHTNSIIRPQASVDWDRVHDNSNSDNLNSDNSNSDNSNSDSSNSDNSISDNSNSSEITTETGFVFIRSNNYAASDLEIQICKIFVI